MGWPMSPSVCWSFPASTVFFFTHLLDCCCLQSWFFSTFACVGFLWVKFSAALWTVLNLASQSCPNELHRLHWGGTHSYYTSWLVSSLKPSVMVTLLGRSAFALTRMQICAYDTQVLVAVALSIKRGSPIRAQFTKSGFVEKLEFKMRESYPDL